MQHQDWYILIGYLVFVFIVGILVTRKAGKGIQSYFVADRSLPWWWLGISIIATTFAADTPLAITGLTANGGISANWFWWSWAITYVTVAILFANRWRKSEVLTDVEFIELRYEGQGASFLRGFKAFYFAIIINCFILGWVMTAMTKITAPFVQWNEIMNPNTFNALSSWYPNFLLFNGDFNTTFTILIVTLIVIVYSSLGGIRGVILTDLFQFVIAIVTAILFAYYAIDYVGGLESLYTQMETLYGAEKTEQYLEFIPSLTNPMTPIYVFLVYVFILWWSRYDSDGTGYIAQRINTAKNPKAAQKGALLFTIGFIALRTWPWIMVALVTMVVFPVGDPAQFHELGNSLINADGSFDRESGYPILMKLILPAGILGLTFTSLMAAFMSTVDTHINWGSSYVVNDLYKRFINPNASKKRLVLVSRLTVVAIAVVAILVSSQMDSIAGAWKFLINAAAGIGIAQILRWLWWRANVWTEITGMTTSLLLTIVSVFAMKGMHDAYVLGIISVVTLAVCILVTLVTKPVSNEKLEAFVNKVKPVGFWNPIASTKQNYPHFGRNILMWVLGVTAAYSSLFSIGNMLMLRWMQGILLVIVFIISFVCLIKLMNKEGALLEDA